MKVAPPGLGSVPTWVAPSLRATPSDASLSVSTLTTAVARSSVSRAVDERETGGAGCNAAPPGFRPYRIREVHPPRRQQAHFDVADERPRRRIPNAEVAARPVVRPRLLPDTDRVPDSLDRGRTGELECTDLFDVFAGLVGFGVADGERSEHDPVAVQFDGHVRRDRRAALACARLRVPARTQGQRGVRRCMYASRAVSDGNSRRCTS